MDYSSLYFTKEIQDDLPPENYTIGLEVGLC